MKHTGNFQPGAAGVLKFRKTSPMAKCALMIAMQKIRLLIVDNHENVRRLLVARLARDPQFEIVGDAPNIASALEVVKISEPHMVLIDPSVENAVGFTTLQQFLAMLPGVVIVALIAVADTAQQMALKKVGVHRVLIKGMSSNHLIQSLVEIADLSTQHPDTLD